MSTTLFVDSACDLPQSFLTKYDVKVLPATILYDGHSMHDYRNTEKTIALYESGVLDKSHHSDTAPTSAKIIQTLVEKAIKQGHDEILIQTVSRMRSPTFEHATEAANRAQKTAARAEKAVSIRVQDSRTVFAGQGVLAAHTVALLRKGVKGTALRRKVDRLSSKVHAYQVPADVFYLRERARRKGDNSISWLGAVVGRTLNIAPIVLALDDKTFPIKKMRGHDLAIKTLFEHTTDKIQHGLLSPFVCISYAGHLAEITALPEFQRMQSVAKEHRNHIIITPMSLSGGVNLGPRTLSVAFACETYNWS
jgi:DegV family protein with EDD domain